jgi:hypothetical protein
VAFTALWLEQDVLQYLDQHTGVTIAEVPAWQQLVSWQQMPVAVISYLARRYQVSTILQWLQQGNSAWLINIQPALELLQVLFSHLSGLAGDWPRLLLNECLLLSFSGHVTVNGTAAFIQLFFTLVDKNTAPPAYKVYEKIQDALLLIRPPETPVAQGLVRVIEKEVKQRLLQRPALLSLPAPANMPPTGLTVTAVKDPPAEAVSRIYAGNAGLVLLHPFFNIFFSRLHLVEKGKFVSDTAMHRAAHLLQYLVDGLPEHEEHLLVLNKLLCGIPLNDPLPLEIELLPEEIELANELFRILFLQWDKMKNATIDGFRQSFLQRQGVLSHNADHWVLRVEQRGYDMLLQTLPWGYSTIRLPWMKELLYVEWI